jgi:hypothetical protein
MRGFEMNADFLIGVTLALFVPVVFVLVGYPLWPDIKNMLGFGKSENPYKWYIVKVTNNGGDVCYKLDGYCYSATHGKWDDPLTRYDSRHWVGSEFDELEHCQSFHDFLKKEWDKKQLEKVKKVERVK